MDKPLEIVLGSIGIALLFVAGRVFLNKPTTLPKYNYTGDSAVQRTSDVNVGGKKKTKRKK
jgi:hypothetical protein